MVSSSDPGIGGQQPVAAPVPSLDGGTAARQVGGMTPPARYATIDALRGLAVMGILLMNITDFALPSGAYFNPLAGGGRAPADLAAWAISFVLVDGKMRALFSILFGASTLIVVERAEAAGLNGTRIHFARMATLALFGAAHLFLIWPGDILLHYALIGIVALPFVAFEPRQQLKIAVLLLCAQFVVGALFFVDFLTLRHAAGLPDASAATLAAWHGFIDGVGIGRAQDVAAEIAVARGSWAGFVAHNLATQAGAPPFLLAFNGLETLAYMLIGMAALRSGFLTGGWTRARYLRTAAIGMAIGLPPTVALCWLSVASGYDTLATFAAGSLGGLPFRPILALAEAALALAWLADRPHRRIEAAGRAAFSNYLGTSVAMMLVFDGWGLGLFDRIERIWLYPIVAAVWLAMLLWSPAWLARFRYGPLEWAWRSLSRGRPQAMRRNDIATVSQ
jgi:uncharacterized protein